MASRLGALETDWIGRPGGHRQDQSPIHTERSDTLDNEPNFQEKSYERHSEHFREYGSGGAKEALAKTWFSDDTVDAWRHRRLYQSIDPILASEPNTTWLTVGDGRYGCDSKYIANKGHDVLASDISTTLLEEAKQIGYIKKYSKENAEKMSFKDNEFDYVFCKESYHHFPRPMLALYEILRVSKKGVVLVEPNDLYITHKLSTILSTGLISLAKSILGREGGKHRFEDSGNYLYGVSRREIEKAALGLNYKTVAFKGINNAYFPGVEHESLAVSGPLQRKLKLVIGAADFLCKLGLMDYTILSAIIFKRPPSAELLASLSKEGYEIIHLPNNPFIA